MKQTTPTAGIWTVLIITVSTLLYISCNGAFGGSPAAPENLIATTTEEGRIILSWDEPKHAGVYYVYRGDTADFEPKDGAEEGNFQASANMPGFIDRNITEEQSYYYKVAAANIYGENPSPPSNTAEGRSHFYRWSSGAGLAPSSETFADAAKALNSDGLSAAALVSSKTGAEGNVSVYLETDTGFVLLSDPASPKVPATLPRKSIALVAQGEENLYLAHASESGGIKVRLWNGASWEAFGPDNGTVGGAGYPGAFDVSLAVSNDILYAAFIYERTGPTDRHPALFQRPLSGTGAWTILSEPDTFEALSGVTDFSGLSLSAATGAPTVMLESEADPGIKELRVYRYGSGQWSALGARLLTEAPLSGSGSLAYGGNPAYLYALFSPEATPGIKVFRFANQAWEEISPAGLHVPASDEKTGIAFRRGQPAVIFVSSIGRISVLEYSGSQWNSLTETDRLPEGDSWTGSGVSLTGAEQKLSALYLTSEDKAELRKFE